ASDLGHTIPCYFYTCLAIPLTAIPRYPGDFLEYAIIDRAKTVTIILRPADYARLEEEVLREWGKGWQIGIWICGIAITVLATVVFLFLSRILSRWYRAKYWRCLSACLIGLVLVSLTEMFV